ncbi:MAG: GlxA family transcriptional regulator [Gammaproteobacteria bacterium]|nr:GlxA family transcriptional regulator [Gammaproteobacteria bacterium]
MANGAAVAVRVGFLQLPRYSMIAFASAIEPLRMANHLSGQLLYQWTTVTFDGEPVAASNGLSLAVGTDIYQAEQPDMLFVCGGMDVRLSFDKPIINWLHRLAHRHVILGGLCTGSYLLARAGLLDGYRATIHWQNIAGMREEFPRIDSTDELFVMDRDRYTCSGGIAPLDMMLTLISQQQGIELAAGISEEFIHERIRNFHDHQRDPLRLRIGLGQPKLIEAVSLMEANVEEPLTLDDLARHVHVSRRQLERLFKQYLKCAPTRYYLKLRLTRARQFLLQTTMPIADVTLACGFVSAPHFSKCYRDLFGVPPSHERRPRELSAIQDTRRIAGHRAGG